MSLPAGFTARSARASDVAELEQLFITLDKEEGVEPSYLGEDMLSAWRRSEFDIDADTFLVSSEHGEIVAYGHVEARPPTDLIAMGWVHPEHRGEGLGAYLVDVMETRARSKRDSAGGGFERVVNIVTQWDRPAAGLLTKAGYRTVRHFWSMELELTKDLQPGIEVAGVKLRNFEVAEVVAAHGVLVDAFRDHWGAEFPGLDDWSAETLERAGYDSTLWWVAEAAGELVGVLIAEVSGGTGWVTDLGVLRDHRNLGIGRALLLRSLNEFKRRGLKRAALGVDSQSPTGATRLYESVGMMRYRQIDFYGKDLAKVGNRGGQRDFR